MRVQAYERQVGIAPLPGANVSAPGGPEAYGAGVGQAVEGLGARAMAIAQDAEDAKTLELFNQFKREDMEYHENPDTGIYHTRVGGGALGVYAEADQRLSERAREYLKKVPGNRAKQNFQKMAGQYREQRGLQNSRFEADQIQKYRNDQAQATIQMGIDAVAGDVWSDETAGTTLDGLTPAWELLNRGKSPEEREASWNQIKNQIALVRLNGMIQDDPIAAREWFKEHKEEFGGQGAARAREAVERAAKVYEVQAFVDEWARLYPEGREQDGIAKIREKFSGPEEEERVRAYRQRLDELSLAEDWEQQRLHRAQEDNYDAYLSRFMNGDYPTYEELTQAAESRGISAARAVQLQNMLGSMATAANVRKHLARTRAGWNSMTEAEQDEAVMNAMPDGPTQEERQAVVSDLLDKIFDNRITESEFKDAVQSAFGNGRLTRREAAELLGMPGKMDKEQKAFVSARKTELAARLRKLFDGGSRKTDPTRKSLAIATAKAAFNTAVEPRNLDYRSATYRKDVIEAMRSALLQAVDASGNALWNEPEGSRVRTPTEFGDRFTALDNVMEIEGRSVEEYIPRFTMDNVNVPTEGERQQAAAPRAQKAGKASYEKFKGAVDGYAKTYGVDAELVRAIIQVESGWKPGAVSRVGAQGLMQLMPGTAAGLGVSNTFDPEQNIRGGTKYISDLIRRYNGDVEKALAAYNAGPKRVPVKGALDLSKLPAETRSYVKNVVALYRRYQGGTKNAGAKQAAYRDAGEVFEGFEN